MHYIKRRNQKSIIYFPKSVKPERIRSNMEIFDVELTYAEMDQIRALDKGKGVKIHD